MCTLECNNRQPQIAQAHVSLGLARFEQDRRRGFCIEKSSCPTFANMDRNAAKGLTSCSKNTRDAKSKYPRDLEGFCNSESIAALQNPTWRVRFSGRALIGP